MNRSIYVPLAIGVVVGALLGLSLNRPETVAREAGANEINAATVAETNAPAAKTRERELLLMAIQELDLTSAELEDARARVFRMERKAKRYDWLRDNGLHADHTMSFSKNTFEPPQKLLDFLGLNEEEAEEMKRISSAAVEAARTWESANATRVAETATNIVYEIGPLPDSHKQGFIAELGGVLHEEDLQLLMASIDEIYDSSERKRKVSATIIPAEEYAKTIRARNPGSRVLANDMIKIAVNRFDENGHGVGSTTSTTTFSASSLAGHGLYQRWNHLIQIEELAR